MRSKSSDISGLHIWDVLANSAQGRERDQTSPMRSLSESSEGTSPATRERVETAAAGDMDDDDSAAGAGVSEDGAGVSSVKVAIFVSYRGWRGGGRWCSAGGRKGRRERRKGGGWDEDDQFGSRGGLWHGRLC